MNYNELTEDEKIARKALTEARVAVERANDALTAAKHTRESTIAHLERLTEIFAGMPSIRKEALR